MLQPVLPFGLARIVASLSDAFAGLFAPIRFKALYGGRGSGKSFSAIVALLALSYVARLRVACAREFQVSLAQSVRHLIIAIIDAADIRADWIIQDALIVHRRTGASFFFLGLARNPDSIKSLEGVDVCLVEEAQTVSALSLEYLIPTIRKPGSEIWFLWNPRFKTDPVNGLFRGAHVPPNAWVRRVSWRDNPAFEASPMFEDMQRDRRRSISDYEHIWEGKYRDASGSAVFTNWRLGEIAVPEAARPLFGLDFGFSPDPTAFVKLYDLANNVLYVAEEAVSHGVSEARMPAFLDTVSESRSRLIRADNDPRMIAALGCAGFRIRRATKGPGSIESGLRFLQGKDIVIHPRCATAADEFANHSWKRDKITGKPIVGEPEDARNHTIDAARYATEDLISQVRFRVLSAESAATRRAFQFERDAEIRARIARLAAKPIAQA